LGSSQPTNVKDAVFVNKIVAIEKIVSTFNTSEIKVSDTIFPRVEIRTKRQSDGQIKHLN